MLLFDFFCNGKIRSTSLKTAVFTTKKVMLENELITRVYHSNDNSLSFMDNYSSNSNENIMIVSLGEVLEKDSTIKAVLDIPVGHCAFREHAKDKWTVDKFLEEDE